MKVAVVYRGMYIRKNRKFDFFSIYQNHLDMFLNYFNNADFFFCTTPSSVKQDEKLISIINWEDYSFTNQNECIYDTIQSSLNFNKLVDYDLIINLRFDVKFNKKFNEFNIDFDKFNFLWREPLNFNQNGNVRVCDHIFIFKSSFLRNFKEIDLKDENVRYKDGGLIGAPDQGHHLMHFLKLDESLDVNFMVDGHHHSGGNGGNSVGKSYFEVLK